MSSEVIAASPGPVTLPELRRAVTVTVEDMMPVLTLSDAIRRRNFMVEVTKTLMVENIDYGAVPGTSKPTLLKPGAERLCSLFGMSPESREQTAIEDFDGSGEGHGEPLFFYKVLVRLTKNGILLGEGIGSCSSRESKYRYRSAERRCPKCGTAAIIRGKEEYGGGWICFARKGGCGAKFKDGDRSIESQPTTRQLNPDVADVANTILKMACKRALVAAVLLATNASEFYTQDVEDMEIIDLPAASAPPPPPSPAPPAKPPEPVAEVGPAPDEVKVMWSQMTNIANMCAIFAKLKGWLMETMGPDAGEAEYYRILWQHGQVKHANELKKSQRLAKITSRKLWEALQQADALRGEPRQREPGEGE
jgi:hypothetical protein